MPVNFGNTIGVSKIIHINVINEVRRLCFRGALLFALILEKLTFLRKTCFFGKYIFFEVLRFLL